MEDTLSLRFRLMDCGHQIAIALRIGSFRRAWRFRNVFRRSLTNAQFLAGEAKYRWPVSLWVVA